MILGRSRTSLCWFVWQTLLVAWQQYIRIGRSEKGVLTVSFIITQIQSNRARRLSTYSPSYLLHFQQAHFSLSATRVEFPLGRSCYTYLDYYYWLIQVWENFLLGDAAFDHRSWELRNWSAINANWIVQFLLELATSSFCWLVYA